MKRAVFAAVLCVIGAPALSADPEHVDAVLAAAESGVPAACRECDLRGANLSALDLSGADLAGADFANADLSGADLTGANLSGSSLIGVNLISTDLTDADLTDANLSRAFIRATRFCGTTLPEGRIDDSGC